MRYILFITLFALISCNITNTKQPETNTVKIYARVAPAETVVIENDSSGKYIPFIVSKVDSGNVNFNIWEDINVRINEYFSDNSYPRKALFDKWQPFIITIKPFKKQYKLINADRWNRESDIFK